MEAVNNPDDARELLAKPFSELTTEQRIGLLATTHSEVAALYYAAALEDAKGIVAASQRQSNRN